MFSSDELYVSSAEDICVLGLILEVDYYLTFAEIRQLICFFTFIMMLSVSVKGIALPEEDETYGRPTVFVLSEYNTENGGGHAVTLSIADFMSNQDEYSCQWYECIDHDGNQPNIIKDATSSVYKTENFNEEGIRFYLCKITEYTSEQNERLPVFIVAYTGLPILSIDTIGGETIWNQEEWVPSILKIIPGKEGGDVVREKISAKGRGNSSWHLTPKCSYSVRFEKSIRLFDLTMGTHFVLIPNYTDKSLLRNWWSGYLCKNVFRDKRWNPSYIQVEFVLNGKYMGNYSFTEKIEIGPERINVPTIKKIYKKTHSLQGMKLGGYVIEIDQHMYDEFVFQTEHGLCFSVKEPNLADLPKEDQEVIVDFIHEYVQELEDRICSMNDYQTSLEATCFELLDMESAVSWYLFKELSKDEDSNFYSSVYFYYDPMKEVLYMSPQWDFDLAYGNYGRGEEDSPEGPTIRNVWFDSLMQSPLFTERVKEQWQAIRRTLLETAIPALMQKANDISASADMNFERWRILGRHVWNNTAGAVNRTTYQSEVDYMVNWVIRRVKWIDEMVDEL